MQEWSVRRLAALEVIKYGINDLTGLVDRQVELAGSEIREGVSGVVKSTAILAMGLAGLVLVVTALAITGILALSLLTARVAFFLLAKGYQLIRVLEGAIQARQAREYSVDGAGLSADDEAA